MITRLKSIWAIITDRVRVWRNPPRCHNCRYSGVKGSTTMYRWCDRLDRSIDGYDVCTEWAPRDD